MKKLVLTLLITLSTTILAKTPDSLFGVYINDNVLDYVTPWEFDSHYEASAKGFYGLEMWFPPIRNKDWSDKLYVKFDNNNKIGSIHSEKKFQNSETCEKVEYDVRKALENKYSKELSKNPYTNYGFYKWVGDNVMMTECRVFSDDDITLIISLHTKKYVVRLNESKSKSRI